MIYITSEQKLFKNKVNKNHLFFGCTGNLVWIKSGAIVSSFITQKKMQVKINMFAEVYTKKKQTFGNNFLVPML